MKYILILALLLTGCSGGGGSSNSPEPKKAMWYGDSRCVENTYLTYRSCFPGRQINHINELDDYYDISIIHIGFNDMNNNVPVNTFKAYLISLVEQTTTEVWCILPTWANYHHDTTVISDYRQAMIDVCPNTSDPQIEGYAEVTSVEEAKIALETLELGVDGIVLRTRDISEIKTATKALADFDEMTEPKERTISLTLATVTRISQLSVGARVCIDTCDLMTAGDGMLVGCGSLGLFLVQAEVHENPHVELVD